MEHLKNQIYALSYHSINFFVTTKVIDAWQFSENRNVISEYLSNKQNLKLRNNYSERAPLVYALLRFLID